MTEDTTPQTPENPAPEPEPEPRRLQRSGSDAVIGGVASGLGRYFGVDPILFRIGFVVLAFIGAAGVVAYLALLVFVPSDGEPRPSGTGSRALAVGGTIVLGCVLITFLSPPPSSSAPVCSSSPWSGWPGTCSGARSADRPTATTRLGPSAGSSSRPSSAPLRSEPLSASALRRPWAGAW